MNYDSEIVTRRPSTPAAPDRRDRAMPAKRHRAAKSPSGDAGLLELLHGTWRTEGQLLGVPVGSGTTLAAVDRYEWVPGVGLLAHYVTGHFCGASVASFEVWAFDRRSQSYVSTSFDENGVPSTFKSRFRDGQWTIVGRTQRFRGTFSKDHLTLSGTWDQKARGIWKPWLAIELRKAGP